jgi:hypothetical protein
MNLEWTKQDTIAILRSKWITVFAEHWRDVSGGLIEYWRVERSDSIIVLPIHRNRLLCPQVIFRPGIGRCTLDFPGGRLATGGEPSSIALGILERELGIDRQDVRSLMPINDRGLVVDSAFSSQKVWGFLAELDSATPDVAQKPFQAFSCSQEGLKELLGMLECMQCRALLYEAINQQLFSIP